MVSALTRDTAQLVVPFMEGRVGLHPAQDTDTALLSGAMLALVGAIEHVFREYVLMNATQSPVLVLTGGDADVLASSLAIPVHKHPDLVLEGLWINLWDEGFLEPHYSPFLSKR
jgi:pantothenate kinase type III